MKYLAFNNLFHIQKDGLPEIQLTNFLSAIQKESPEAIIIGDSFVETGIKYENGWIRGLINLTGKNITTFGLGGAAPSQYFAVYDRVRQIYPDIPILILFYLGNDLVDESIFSSVSPNFSRYDQERRRIYSDSKSNPYWPCFRTKKIEQFKRFLTRNSALFLITEIAYLRLKNKVIRIFRGYFNSNYFIENLAYDRCHNPPFSEIIGGRIFFFELHNFSVNTKIPKHRISKKQILSNLLKRAHDNNLTFTIILDRQEICKNFHNKQVITSHQILNEFQQIGVDTFDSNSYFEEICPHTNLYMSDGHWNHHGHKLFSEIVANDWSAIKDLN